jgi:hypothetical protein
MPLAADLSPDSSRADLDLVDKLTHMGSSLVRPKRTLVLAGTSQLVEHHGFQHISLSLGKSRVGGMALFNGYFALPSNGFFRGAPQGGHLSE